MLFVIDNDCWLFYLPSTNRRISNDLGSVFGVFFGKGNFFSIFVGNEQPISETVRKIQKVVVLRLMVMLIVMALL